MFLKDPYLKDPKSLKDPCLKDPILRGLEVLIQTVTLFLLTVEPVKRLDLLVQHALLSVHQTSAQFYLAVSRRFNTYNEVNMAMVVF